MVWNRKKSVSKFLQICTEYGTLEQEEEWEGRIVALKNSIEKMEKKQEEKLKFVDKRIYKNM